MCSECCQDVEIFEGDCGCHRAPDAARYSAESLVHHDHDRLISLFVDMTVAIRDFGMTAAGKVHNKEKGLPTSGDPHRSQLAPPSRRLCRLLQSPLLITIGTSLNLHHALVHAMVGWNFPSSTNLPQVHSRTCISCKVATHKEASHHAQQSCNSRHKQHALHAISSAILMLALTSSTACSPTIRRCWRHLEEARGGVGRLHITICCLLLGTCEGHHGFPDEA